MPRNFRRRVEIMFPIEDPRLQNRIVDGILGVVLLGQRQGPRAPARRHLPPRPAARPGEPVIRSQVEFQNMARELSSADPIRPATRGGSPAGVFDLPSCDGIEVRGRRNGSELMKFVTPWFLRGQHG